MIISCTERLPVLPSRLFAPSRYHRSRYPGLPASIQHCSYRNLAVSSQRSAVRHPHRLTGLALRTLRTTIVQKGLHTRRSTLRYPRYNGNSVHQDLRSSKPGYSTLIRNIHLPHLHLHLHLHLLLTANLSLRLWTFASFASCLHHLSSTFRTSVPYTTFHFSTQSWSLLFLLFDFTLWTAQTARGTWTFQIAKPQPNWRATIVVWH